MPEAASCSLSPAQQTRNLILFAACTAGIYLSAPVNYVGTTQASLCRRLGASDTVANLPSTLFFLMTFTPVVLAWLVPRVRALVPLMATCFFATALAISSVGLLLPLDVPDPVKIAAVILQGGVSGAAMPTAIALLWEAIGRGAEQQRRGQALALAFGLGPLVAMGGSFTEQLLLTGKLGDWITLPGLVYPWNFTAVYAAVVPVLLVVTGLCLFFVVPLPEKEPPRESFFQSVLGGLAVFVRDPVLRYAAIATVLLYVGNTIPPNLNLYAKQALGVEPETVAGLQNAYRFGFKVVTGLLLGWLLTRTSPRLGVLVTGTIFVTAVAWATTVTGEWYLLTFGLYGAGELVGVYAPNYILSASRPEDTRRNMALVTLMMLPAAPFGTLFGWLSDHFGSRYDPTTGFRISFAVCLAVMLAGLLVAASLLPPSPRPAPDRREDT